MAIKTFKELNNNDSDIAGGKGASLGEMTQEGIKIPPGFVILAETFDNFLNETDLLQEIEAQLEKVNYDDINSVEKCSKLVRTFIKQAELPKNLVKEFQAEFKKLGSRYVAVRSSATAEDSTDASWAGELESFLNTTEKNLLDNIKNCWSSLFTPRAIFYRKEKDLHAQHISVAVVVQEMVESEISGISFTVHPVTEDFNQMIIEAVWGLGEAIVSGSVTPDSYVIEKDDWNLLDININAQNKQLVRNGEIGNKWIEVDEDKKQTQILSGEQIIELAKICQKIEDHYGCPQDIEWAFRDSKFYIVQSRPITTLNLEKKLDFIEEKQKIFKKKYERVFGGPGMPFLVSDIITDVYVAKYKFIIIYTNQIWTCYMPIEEKEKTLAEGFKLYSNEKEYNKFRKEYLDFINSFDLKFNKIFAKDKIVNNEVFRLVINLFKEAEIYYAYTQYFYTDSLLVNHKNFEPDFGKLKEKGRTLLNKLYFSKENYLKFVLTAISNTINVSIENLYNCTLDEVRELLVDSNKSKIKRVKNKIFIVYSEDEKKHTLVGKEAQEQINQFLNYHDKQVKKLIGTVANKGIAIGKACILDKGYKHKNISKFINNMTKEDVLIAETTSPEIMIACNKAVAIVTNQGGLMSHAAIISREIGIPCIVGVEKATKIIKNGDLVEVNANKGEIKILKQKK